MKRYVLMGIALLLVMDVVRAAVLPQMINYTGTVQVNSNPFNGDGYFRFALINDHSECQTDPPGPNCDAYWSNDATSVDGEAPANALKITVTNGLFSIKLGDTNRINYNSTISMPAVPGNVFDHPVVYLRVWFDDGVHGLQHLVPDRQLVAVPFAYRAEVAEKLSGVSSVTQENLAPASVTTATIANQAVTSEKIANGTITGADVSSSATLNILGLSVDGPTLNVDSTNNRVGLGTTAPDSPLHIKASPASADLARIVVENGSGNKFFLNTFTNENKFSLGRVGVADDIVIDGNGKVGIGTTTPGVKLDVAGTAAVDYLRVDPQDGVNEGGEIQLVGAGTNGTVQLDNFVGNIRLHTLAAGKQFQVVGGSVYADGTTAANYFAGNVGIGVANPSAKLHVASTAAVPGANLLVTNGSKWIGFVETGAGSYNSATVAHQALVFSNDGDPAVSTGGFSIVPHANTAGGVQIMENGNVGIGVREPTTWLQVAGEISPSADNSYSLGDVNLRFTEVYAVNGVIQTSDARQKKDILPSDLGLDFINKLRPVSYHWNSGEDTDLHYGLIAQETETAINEAKAQIGTQASSPEPRIVTHDPVSDRYGLKYTELIAPMIKASQEIHRSLTETKGDVVALEAENAQLKINDAAKDKELAELKARLDKIEKLLNSR